jgi:transposase
MDENFSWFVGIDCSVDNYQVCLVDTGGRVVSERTVPHNGSGISRFLDWLIEQTSNSVGQVAVAIETPRGVIVESLVEREYGVFAINPKQLDRFRDRYSIAGAKDDRRDAFVLADSLRTDRHCFRRVQTDNPLIIRIRDLSRMEDDLQQDWCRLTNQLREQLHRYYPQMLHLSAAADDPWVWELIEMAPQPAQVLRLHKDRVQKLLRKYRIRRYSAPGILAELQTEPLLLVAGTAEAASEVCLLLIARLRLLHRQKVQIAKRIEDVLGQLTLEPAKDEDGHGHRDVELLRSLPGIGRIVAATMLAEASQPLIRRDYHALRAYGGIAPVTRQSGKKRQILMRYGCNTRLRNVLYHWSRVSMQHDERSRQHYHRLRRSGHSHGRALRGVADRLLAVLIAMLRQQTPYDPQRRQRIPEISHSFIAESVQNGPEQSRARSVRRSEPLTARTVRK